ncbi:argininosuccinate synthase [Proteus mirabilis]|uniref:Argininosuccinate synthase n=1 Tax=Proteus mirabilis TaxID=584 RepID=A0A379EZI9_PROMI|nr:argininosuccinate synthase [Proteus mirabilis]
MMAALRGVEQLVLDRDAFKWRQQLGLEMSYVVYDGRWFTPIRLHYKLLLTRWHRGKWRSGVRAL